MTIGRSTDEKVIKRTAELTEGKFRFENLKVKIKTGKQKKNIPIISTTRPTNRY